jgi:uridine kinase
MTQSNEPGRDHWQVVPFTEVANAVRRPGIGAAQPWIVAVDGRSASGKTTLADRLATVLPRSVIVHTDDLAWHESFFGWAGMLRNEVLTPVRRGLTVAFTPPAWPAHDRDGAITVPADIDLLIVEGVGSSRRGVRDLVDVAIWMHADRVEARRRGLARDIAAGVNGDEDETIAFWDEWDAAERAFLEEDRPWERADLVVSGTPHLAVGPDDVLVKRREWR